MNSFLKSFAYAFNGIKISLQQRNIKIQSMCGIVAIAFGFWFKITTIEWCIILVCIGAVIALEALNTAIEALVDLVEPNQNPLAGKVKDVAASAVLVFAFVSGLIGVIIFGKYIL